MTLEGDRTLQERKVVKRFRLLDVDQDGSITRADYESLVERLLDAYPARRGTPAADRLRDSYLKLWRALAFSSDADGDGKVSREEFAKAVLSGVIDRGDGFDRAIRPVFEAVLEFADTDGSQTLSPEEFAKLIGVFGVSAGEAEECFHALDADSDKRLTSAEIIAAGRVFYVSGSPDDPANLLFGRF